MKTLLIKELKLSSIKITEYSANLVLQARITLYTETNSTKVEYCVDCWHEQLVKRLRKSFLTFEASEEYYNKLLNKFGV